MGFAKNRKNDPTDIRQNRRQFGNVSDQCHCFWCKVAVSIWKRGCRVRHIYFWKWNTADGGYDVFHRSILSGRWQYDRFYQTIWRWIQFYGIASKRRDKHRGLYQSFVSRKTNRSCRKCQHGLWCGCSNPKIQVRIFNRIKRYFTEHGNDRCIWWGTGRFLRNWNQW